MKTKIQLLDSNCILRYATMGSSGFDLHARLSEPITLFPGERQLIPAGFKIEIPYGYEAQIRPRSGLALKHGITVLNSPGTIDSDYRGEVGVILINHGDNPYAIHPYDRIAQMVIARVELCELWLGDLSETERGENGFGHTGT